MAKYIIQLRLSNPSVKAFKNLLKVDSLKLKK